MAVTLTGSSPGDKAFSVAQFGNPSVKVIQESCSQQFAKTKCYNLACLLMGSMVGYLSCQSNCLFL